MVTHQKISLFDVPKGEIIVHACNSQGVWGSGIAKPFKEKYPESFKDYNKFVLNLNEERGTACGRGGLSSHVFSEDHWVGWIVTSHNYSSLKDSPDLIKIQTTLALRDFCTKVYRSCPSEGKINHPITVYSNKFNSGLFNVPWADSELILNTVLKDFKRINWVVCDPEGN